MVHIPRLIPVPAYDRYVVAVHSGNAREATAVVLELGDRGYSPDTIIQDLIAPAQRDTGSAWAAGRLSIVEEHRATAIAESALSALMTSFADTAPVSSGRVLLCAAEDEWHSIATRMVAVVWQNLGWEVTLVVPSAPAEDVADMVQMYGHRIAGVSCAMPANLFGAWRVISALRRRGCWVLSGGRGFGDPQTAPEVAARLGADAYLPAALAASHLLAEMAEGEPPEPREGAGLGAGGRQAAILIRQQHRIAADCADLAAALHPELVDSDETRQQLLDDLGLMLRATATSVMLSDPRWLAGHIAWCRELLTSSGSDPETAGFWLELLDRRLPREAHLAAAQVSAAMRNG